MSVWQKVKRFVSGEYAKPLFGKRAWINMQADKIERFLDGHAEQIIFRRPLSKKEKQQILYAALRIMKSRRE